MIPIWTDEILRDLAQRLDDARELVRTNIERDLGDQGASSESIRDSLAGVDELFDQRLQRGLAAGGNANGQSKPGR